MIATPTTTLASARPAPQTLPSGPGGRGAPEPAAPTRSVRSFERSLQDACSGARREARATEPGAGRDDAARTRRGARPNDARPNDSRPNDSRTTGAASRARHDRAPGDSSTVDGTGTTTDDALAPDGTTDDGSPSPGSDASAAAMVAVADAAAAVGTSPSPARVATASPTADGTAAAANGAGRHVTTDGTPSGITSAVTVASATDAASGSDPVRSTTPGAVSASVADSSPGDNPPRQARHAATSAHGGPDPSLHLDVSVSSTAHATGDPAPALGGRQRGTVASPPVAAQDGTGAVTVGPPAVAAPAAAAAAPAAAAPGGGAVPAWVQQAVQAQLAGQLVAAARGSDAGVVRRLTLHLHPADLGTVQVVATIDDGTVSLQLMAGNASTRDALRASLHTLRADLAAAGLDGTQLDVSDQTPSGQHGAAHQPGQSWSDGTAGGGRPGVGGLPGTGPRATGEPAGRAAVGPAAPALSTSRGVDLHL